MLRCTLFECFFARFLIQIDQFLTPIQEDLFSLNVKMSQINSLRGQSYSQRLLKIYICSFIENKKIINWKGISMLAKVQDFLVLNISKKWEWRLFTSRFFMIWDRSCLLFSYTCVNNWLKVTNIFRIPVIVISNEFDDL